MHVWVIFRASAHCKHSLKATASMHVVFKSLAIVSRTRFMNETNCIGKSFFRRLFLYIIIISFLYFRLEKSLINI